MVQRTYSARRKAPRRVVRCPSFPRAPSAASPVADGYALPAANAPTGTLTHRTARQRHRAADRLRCASKLIGGKEKVVDIREEETEEAVSFAVSLDGVPLRPDENGEACWREASCGTVSFHDGNRLKTLSFGQEARKETLKALLAEEVAPQDAA